MATKSTSAITQQDGAAATATANKPGLRKPTFVKVETLKPGTNGHTLIVKVVESNTVLSKKPRNPTFRGPQNQNTKIAECLIGDETGTILFTARNDQVELMKPGNTVVLRNAKIDMFKGSMRLAVDKWGRVELTEPEKFVVKEENNLSLVEYELVNVEES
ncbi:Nucleic acid-binding [Perilla frutescens var. hirtella]|nr:Nucleic acid-binding [Perilla frutescens var. frutescens]KAH6792940.1 Nucleic acid-binding [Perilla frutescens var. hirtella]